MTKVLRILFTTGHYLLRFMYAVAMVIMMIAILEMDNKIVRQEETIQELVKAVDRLDRHAPQIMGESK